MTLFEAAPYQNIILTGAMGVGKTTVGRAVATRLKVEMYDLENEILTREGQSADQIRELFGEARLRALETEALRDLTLRRQSVVVINGPAMLEQVNRDRLVESGPMLCLTCTLNEILRRMYVARGAWFHNPTNRSVLLSRLKRELYVNSLDLPQLNTSELSIDATSTAVIEYWFSHAQM